MEPALFIFQHAIKRISNIDHRHCLRIVDGYASLLAASESCGAGKRWFYLCESHVGTRNSQGYISDFRDLLSRLSKPFGVFLSSENLLVWFRGKK